MINIENEVTNKGFEISDTIHICYASSHAYAKYLSLAMATVLMNKAESDKICFHILDGGLSENDKNKILHLKNIADFEIEFAKVDTEKFLNCPLGKRTHLSLATYYRLVLADMLPQVNKVLYLDCDVEVKTSLKELYNEDISEYSIGAITDISSKRHCERLSLPGYYNAGVLLINLDKWREFRFAEHVFEWIEENIKILKLLDQDVVNIYFKDSIKCLDKKWNAQGRLKFDEYDEIVKGANVIHFIGTDKGDFVFKNIKAALKTEFKIPLIRLYIFRCIKFIGQWAFVIRNKDEHRKQITIFGLRFNIRRK